MAPVTNNIINLNDQLKASMEEAREDASQVFKNNLELTEEEKARLEAMKQEKIVALSETGTDGAKLDTSGDEYTKTLDDRIAAIKNDKYLKLLNTAGKNSDITKSFDEIKSDSRKTALNAFKDLAISNHQEQEMDDEDYIKINDDAIASIQKYFKMDRLDSDLLIKKMSKMTLREISAILPQPFVNAYLSEDEIKFNTLKGKERILAAIGYLCVTGPEMDYLNDYIEEENKLTVVSKRLLQCQLDFAEMLKDETKLSELVAKSKVICPDDTSFWAKYIKVPNQMHNEFAQRVIIYQEYKSSYETILEEYKEDVKAASLIQDEINECDNKIKVYQDITNLTLMKDLWKTLIERYHTDKRLSMNFLQKEAVDSIERIRRSKINVPFPGYNKKLNKSSAIYNEFITIYPKMIMQHNFITEGIKKKEEVTESEIHPIHVDGYNDKSTVTVFSNLLLILMGRILKACTKPNMNKYDAIVADSYFQLFCKVGTDIYFMNDIWNIMKDFITSYMNKFARKEA